MSRVNGRRPQRIFVDEIAESVPDARQPVECPDHGPMGQLYHRGMLVEIRCEVCGKQPIDLLERRRV